MRQALGVRTLLLLTLTLAACNADDVSRVKPILVVDDATIDPSGAADYVLDFGSVRVGRTQREAVTLANAGAARLLVDPVTTEAPFVASLAQRELNASARARLEFAFTPTSEATFEQRVTVTSTGGTANLRLVGRGVAVEPCRLVPNPSSVDFGPVLMGSSAEQVVVLTNEGGDTCRVTKLALVAGAGSAYSLLTSGGTTTVELAPAGWTEFIVRFRPTAAGPQLGTVEVTTDDVEPLRVQLTGNGDEPCPGALPDGTCPVAEDPVYVNTSDQLFSYDPADGVATLVGTFKDGGATVDAMTDIAIDTAGTMLGVRAKGNGASRVAELYRINPATAEVSKIANLGGAITGTLNGLTFLADGRLILAGESVWVIHRSTGAVISTLVPKGAYETSGDIIALPDGYLYWSVRGATSGGNDRLVRINPNDGGTRVVGTTSKSGIYGLGYGNDTLYGFSSDKTSFAISPDNAATSQTRTTDGSWWGATTNPVLW